MFEQLNEHKYLDLLAIGETKDMDLRLVIAEAIVSEKSATFTAELEPNEILREMLNECNPIETTSLSKCYEIVFSDPIASSIINESYSFKNEKEQFEGKLARIYTTSTFLDYISNATIATADYPGPFKHYGFVCLNRVVDVVSMEPPLVKKIND